MCWYHGCPGQQSTNFKISENAELAVQLVSVIRLTFHNGRVSREDCSAGRRSLYTLARAGKKTHLPRLLGGCGVQADRIRSESFPNARGELYAPCLLADRSSDFGK